MDIFKKIDDTRGGTLGKYQEVAHGYFAFPKLEGDIGPRMKFRGKSVLNWSMSNYLGLANDTEVRLTDTQAVVHWGLAYPMGTRIVSGQTSSHEELEERIASFLGKEDAFVVNFGYQAMMSIIYTLCDRYDVIVYDSEASPSIMDGVLLHRAKGGKSFVFTHNDVDNCRKKIQLAESYIKGERRDGGILVLTDGVFEMSGELGILDKIVALKDEYDFSLLVDDAHGFGVMGPNGRGTAEHFGVTDKVVLIFGSFAKAMAGIGGFIAGTEKVINYLRYNMRSQIYDESLPLTMVLGLLKRLELAEGQPERRQQVWRISNALRSGLAEAGFDVGKSQSLMVPVLVRNTATQADDADNADDAAINSALSMVMDMRENYGIFCPIVKHPVVPKGTLMLRFIPTANHKIDDVEYTVSTMCELKAKYEAGEYDNQSLLK